MKSYLKDVEQRYSTPMMIGGIVLIVAGIVAQMYLTDSYRIILFIVLDVTGVLFFLRATVIRKHFGADGRDGLNITDSLGLVLRDKDGNIVDQRKDLGK